VRLLQQVGGVLVHRVVADVAVERDADFLPVYVGELLEPLVAVADEEQVIREVDVVERVPFGDVVDLGHDARHGLAAQVVGPGFLLVHLPDHRLVAERARIRAALLEMKRFMGMSRRNLYL